MEKTISDIKQELIDRKNTLFNSELNDHEWNCNFNQCEYFILSMLTENNVIPYDVDYELITFDNHDSFLIENPLLNLKVKEVVDVLELISLLFDTCTLKEVNRFISKNQKVFDNINLNSFFYETIESGIDIITAKFRSYDYFYETSFSDLLTFIGNSLSGKLSYSLNVKSNSDYKIWIQVLFIDDTTNEESNDEDNNDHFPHSDLTGFLNCKVINKDSNIISDKIIYWNGEKFEKDENDIVYAWKMLDENIENRYSE